MARVEPQRLSEVAAAIGAAAGRGARVSIEREGGDVVLSLRRLDRILEHEAGDLTVTVEAGITLSALNGALAEHGQMLALDPPGDPAVGAAVAADAFGPRAYRYGRPRDLVLGITAVLGDGLVASAGGKVVKNVAGYDLSKLFCGSRGRLGALVRASFRLHPRPQVERTLMVEIADAAQAARIAGELLHSQLAASAVDLLWDGDGGRLCLLLEGSERAVEAQVGRSLALLGGRELAGDVWAQARERQAAATSRRAFALRDLPTVLSGLAGGLVRLGAPCFAYGDGEQPAPDPAFTRLAERVRGELDPKGVFL